MMKGLCISRLVLAIYIAEKASSCWGEVSEAYLLYGHEYVEYHVTEYSRGFLVDS